MLIKDWAIFRKIKSGLLNSLGFPGGASGEEPACQCRRHKRRRFDPWVQKIPWRRTWQQSPVSLAGDSHAQRSLAGCIHRVAKSRTGLQPLGMHCTAVSGGSDFERLNPLSRGPQSLLFTPTPL